MKISIFFAALLLGMVFAGKAQAFTFLEMSDTQSLAYWDSDNCDIINNESTYNILQRAAAHNPDFTIVAGDLIGQGTVEEFAQAKQTFTSLGLFSETVKKFYSIPDDHDNSRTWNTGSCSCALSETPNATTGYYPFTNFLNAFDPTERKTYYSFDRENTHFIAINTMDFSAACSKNNLANDPQFLWLKADLIAAAARRNLPDSDPQHLDWIIVYYHTPNGAYSAYNYGSTYIQEYLDPVLYQYNVDIVFRGHEHNYTRSFPIQINNGYHPENDVRNDSRGITYITTVAGGNLRSATFDRWWIDKGVNLWTTSLMTVNGRTLEGTIYGYDTETQDEFVYDRFTVVKNVDGTRQWTDLPKTLSPIAENYEHRGVGGGGGMSGFAVDPFNPSLWFVGTDMGTFFRSINSGTTWGSIDQAQTSFSADLDNTVSPGFSSDGLTIFHASAGRDPKRSTDTGITWSDINIPLASDEHIRFWLGHGFQPGNIFCATTESFYYSYDKGVTWNKSTGIFGRSTGIFIDYVNDHNDKIYAATENAIYLSADEGKSFQLYYSSPSGIRAFTGGRSSAGLTLSFIDNSSGGDCSSVAAGSCGFVWLQKNNGTWTKTTQIGGKFIYMAENDSQTIYVTASPGWRDSTKVWVSTNGGTSWEIRFLTKNPDNAELWPENKFEYSGVGLDVGYWDDGFISFGGNLRNSNTVGATGEFFLHTSIDQGQHWLSPFTVFADTGARVAGKKWRSNGLEMTSIYRLKFHPSNPQLVYAGAADITGYVSEDGGNTFRFIRPDTLNSIYDFAFDPADDNLVYVAASNAHDWPHNEYGNVNIGEDGGIFRSNDRGRTWTKLTTDDQGFLSVAYDYTRHIIYGGTIGAGIVRSLDDGVTWNYFNTGIFQGNGRIIPQIEIDQSNGNVYALLSGDQTGAEGEGITNQNYTGIYFLDVAKGTTSWTLLRGTVQAPPELAAARPNGPYWYYPSCFAIDFSNPNVIWLGDIANVHGDVVGPTWLDSGIWKTTDRGQTWQRKIEYAKPTGITIDHNRPNFVYVGGLWEFLSTSVNGGAFYTTNGGASWQKYSDMSNKDGLYRIVLDPNDETGLFFTYFGGGLEYGHRSLSSDNVAPSIPANLVATPFSFSQINLSWTASTDNVGIAGYHIYRNGSLISNSATNSYSSTGLLASTLYSYTVSAYDDVGNTSGQSSAASATTLVFTDTQSPSGSISINSSSEYTKNILVSLALLASDVSGVTQMKLSDISTNFSSLTALSFSSPYSWTLLGLDGVKTVYAWFADSLGNWNNTPFSDTIILDRVSPDITNIAVSNISTNSATLTWTTSELSVSSVDYGLTSGYGQSTTEEITPITTHSTMLSGLSSATNYNFRINATDRAGNRSVSINQTFRTASTSIPDTIPPAQITNLSANNIQSSSADLHWTATGDDNNTGLAKSYIIKYSTTAISDTNTQTQINNWWNSASLISQSLIPKLSGQSEVFTVLNLNPSTSYYFAIQALDEANNTSTISNILNLSTPATPVVTPPSNGGGGGGGGGSSGGGSSGGSSGSLSNTTNSTESPSHFLAIGAKNQVYLSWSNPINTNFVGVKLYRKLNSALTSQTDAQGKMIYQGTQEQFNDLNIPTSSQYYYTIYAYDRSSHYSNPVTVSATLDQAKQTITIPKTESPLSRGVPSASEAGGVSSGSSSDNSTKRSLVGVKSSEVETITRSESQDLTQNSRSILFSPVTLKIYQKIIVLAEKPQTDDNKYAIANFIHSGTPTTIVTGAGERGGSIASFRSAFGRLPQTQTDWQDVIKIANGRWPSQRNIAAEAKVQGNTFAKIYGRTANLKNTNDSNAVTVMTYGLRPAQRNTASEKAAIKAFRYVFHVDPTSASDWDVVRAIAYSGAKR